MKINPLPFYITNLPFYFSCSRILNKIYHSLRDYYTWFIKLVGTFFLNSTKIVLAYDRNNGPFVEYPDRLPVLSIGRERSPSYLGSKQIYWVKVQTFMND